MHTESSLPPDLDPDAVRVDRVALAQQRVDFAHHLLASAALAYAQTQSEADHAQLLIATHRYSVAVREHRAALPAAKPRRRALFRRLLAC